MKNIGKTYKEKIQQRIILVYSYEKERQNKIDTMKNIGCWNIFFCAF